MKFSDEHLILRDTVRKRMAEQDIKEMIKKYEHHNAPFAWEFVRAMAELGLTGINIPEEYGGAGMDNRSGVIAIIEMSRVWPGGALVLGVGNSLAGYPLIRFGSAAQKEKYLPDLAAGKILGAFCLTEPGFGSDAANIATFAESLYDGYLINGTKDFITNAPAASFFILFARTDKKAAPHKGISAFVVPMNERIADKSIVLGKIHHKEGLHAAQMCEVAFKDHFTCHCALLGKEGQGFGIAMQTLDHGRNWIAAQLGIIDGLFEKCKRHAENRKTFGLSLIKRPAIRHVLAKLAFASDVSKMLLFHSAKLEDEDKPFGHYASLAKLFSSEELAKIKGEAQSVYGGMGYLYESDIPHFMTAGDAPPIYEGASNVQRSVILDAWIKRKLLLSAFIPFHDTPTENSLELLKQKVERKLNGKKALESESQVFAFAVADFLPLVAAYDLLQNDFLKEWPGEFMHFKNPSHILRILESKFRKEWPDQNKLDVPVWDSAAEDVL